MVNNVPKLIRVPIHIIIYKYTLFSFPCMQWVYIYICVDVAACYRIRFNFRGVYISQILSFSDFCVLIFADGHVLPLHKSPI